MDRSTKRPLKEGGTTGNPQIDNKLRNQSETMAQNNPKAANIHNNFQSKTEREHRQRWPVDE